MPNGVQYNLSVNTDIIATKESVDKVNADLNNTIGELSTELSNTITNVGTWEDITSEFTPTSIITQINRLYIIINKVIGLVYFNIDVNGNFCRTTDIILQKLFEKSTAIRNLTFNAAYGVYNNKVARKKEMPYQIICDYDGIGGWLPEVIESNYILVTGIAPIISI